MNSYNHVRFTSIARDAAFLSAITLAAVAPFLLLNRQLLFNLDNVHQTFVWWEYTVREIQSGTVPLWNPFVASGMTNIGEGQMFALYPISAAWILALGPFAGSQTSIVLFTGIHIFVLSMGFLLLLRSFRIPKTGVWIGTIVGTFSGAFLYRSISQLNIFWAMSWIPLAAALFVFSLRDKRPTFGVLSGGILALSIYAGHFQGVILIAPVLAAVGILHVIFVQPRWQSFLDIVKSGGLLATSLFVCALPQIWATAQYLPSALRFVSADRPYLGSEKLPYAVVAANPHFDFMSFPGILFTSSQPTLDGSWFIAFPAALLAIVGIFSKFPKRLVAARIFGITGVTAGVILGLGPNTPVLRAWLLIPGISALREPARYDVWFALGIACLASLGALRMAKLPKSRFVIACIALIGGAVTTMVDFPNRNLAVALLAIGVVSAVWVKPRKSGISSGRATKILVISVVVFTPLFFTWVRILPPKNANISEVATPQNTFTQEVAQLWQQLPNPADLSSDTGRAITLTDGLPPNSGTLYQRLSTSSYSATLPSSVYALMNSGESWETALNILGVKFVVSRDANGNPEIVRREGSHPFAWFAQPVSTQVESVGDILAKFKQPTDVYSKTYFSEQNLAQGCNGAVVTSQVQTNRAHMQFNCPTGGTLVTAIGWDKNWAAFIDGRRVTTYRANASSVAVEVAPGNTQLELRYEPDFWSWFAVGLALTGGAANVYFALRAIRVNRSRMHKSARKKFDNHEKQAS